MRRVCQHASGRASAYGLVVNWPYLMRRVSPLEGAFCVTEPSVFDRSCRNGEGTRAGADGANIDSGLRQEMNSFFDDPSYYIKVSSFTGPELKRQMLFPKFLHPMWFIPM